MARFLDKNLCMLIKLEHIIYDSLNSNVLFDRIFRGGGTTIRLLSLGMNLCLHKRDNSQFPNPTANLVSVFGERTLYMG